ncbi:DoxX family protein [Coraliomargarita sp. W4R53]
MNPTNKKSLIIDLPLTFLSIIMLSYFAIPKITHSEISLKGFADFSPALGLDPLSFMIFTGYMELTIAALFLVGLFLIRTKPLVLWIANGLLFGTMASALYIEYFARTKTVNFLVMVAFAFVILSIIQLVRHSAAVMNLVSPRSKALSCAKSQ